MWAGLVPNFITGDRGSCVYSKRMTVFYAMQHDRESSDFSLCFHLVVVPSSIFATIVMTASSTFVPSLQLVSKNNMSCWCANSCIKRASSKLLLIIFSWWKFLGIFNIILFIACCRIHSQWLHQLALVAGPWINLPCCPPEIWWNLCIFQLLIHPASFERFQKNPMTLYIIILLFNLFSSI